MIEMACPGCGRGGQVPKEKLYTRLVCRKCHVVFHMEPSGRTVLGEPQSAKDAKTEEKKKKEKAKGPDAVAVLEGLHLPSMSDVLNVRANLADGTFPVKPVLAGVGVLVVGWLVLSFLNRAPESVAERARIVVEAIAHDDLNRVKGYASGSSVDDVVKWYEIIHTRLDTARKSWPSKESTVQVLVVEDDPKSNRGEIEAFILPADSGVQTAAVMPPPMPPPPGPVAKSSTPSTPPPPGPVGFHLKWDYSGSHWWIDGTSSLALASSAAQ